MRVCWYWWIKLKQSIIYVRVKLWGFISTILWIWYSVNMQWTDFVLCLFCQITINQITEQKSKYVPVNVFFFNIRISKSKSTGKIRLNIVIYQNKAKGMAWYGMASASKKKWLLSSTSTWLIVFYLCTKLDEFSVASCSCSVVSDRQHAKFIWRRGTNKHANYRLCTKISLFKCR